MPGERLSMRKIRELLRLRWEQNLSQRVTANSLRLSQASVSEYPQPGSSPALRSISRNLRQRSPSYPRGDRNPPRSVLQGMWNRVGTL